MVSGLKMSIVWTASLAGARLGVPSIEVDDFLWARWLVILAATVLLLRYFMPKSRATPVQFAKELFIVVPFYFAYYSVRGIVEGRIPLAFENSAKIVEFERNVGIFWEQDLQALIRDNEFLVHLMNWIYVWGFWPVIVLAAVWLFLRNREVYSVYRNAFIISGAIGLLVFATFPVAPPRFMGALGIVDTVAAWSETYRTFVMASFVNRYAAMPSLHFGWTLLIGIAFLKHGPGLLPKLFGIVLPAAMMASIVSTGNHYIVDGAAGGGVALFSLAAAFLLSRLSEGSAGQGGLEAVPTVAASAGGSGLANAAR